MTDPEDLEGDGVYIDYKDDRRLLCIGANWLRDNGVSVNSQFSVGMEDPTGHFEVDVVNVEVDWLELLNCSSKEKDEEE